MRELKDAEESGRTLGSFKEEELEKQFLQKLRGLARNCYEVIVENAFKRKGVKKLKKKVF